MYDDLPDIGTKLPDIPLPTEPEKPKQDATDKAQQSKKGLNWSVALDQTEELVLADDDSDTEVPGISLMHLPPTDSAAEGVDRGEGEGDVASSDPIEEIIRGRRAATPEITAQRYRNRTAPLVTLSPTIPSGDKPETDEPPVKTKVYNSASNVGGKKGKSDKKTKSSKSESKKKSKKSSTSSKSEKKKTTSKKNSSKNKKTDESKPDETRDNIEKEKDVEKSSGTKEKEKKVIGPTWKAEEKVKAKSPSPALSNKTKTVVKAKTKSHSKSPVRKAKSSSPKTPAKSKTNVKSPQKSKSRSRSLKRSYSRSQSRSSSQNRKLRSRSSSRRSHSRSRSRDRRRHSKSQSGTPRHRRHSSYSRSRTRSRSRRRAHTRSRSSDRYSKHQSYHHRRGRSSHSPNYRPSRGAYRGSQLHNYRHKHSNRRQDLRRYLGSDKSDTDKHSMHDTREYRELDEDVDPKRFRAEWEPNTKIISQPSRTVVQTYELVPSGNNRRVTGSGSREQPIRLGGGGVGGSFVRSSSPVRFPSPGSPEIQVLDPSGKALPELVVLSDSE